LVFVSGSLALDLAGTVLSRGPAQVDLLDAPDAVVGWLVEGGLGDPVPEVDDSDVEQCTALREAIYRLVLGGLRGERWGPTGSEPAQRGGPVGTDRRGNPARWWPASYRHPVRGALHSGPRRRCTAR